MICGQQDREQVKTVHLFSEDLANVGNGRILVVRLSSCAGTPAYSVHDPLRRVLLLCA
jgi:hypothetical protein